MADITNKVINKAWHLLNAFDYDFIKKKEIVLLENGCNAAGTINYISITTTQNLFEYKFNYNSYNGWSMSSRLIENQ